MGRRSRSQPTQRRAAAIVVIGVCTWLLLWWTGRASAWTTAAVVAAVALLLALSRWPGQSHSEEDAAARAAAGKTSEPEETVPDSWARTPNAVRPEYNTLPEEWPPRAPRPSTAPLPPTSRRRRPPDSDTAKPAQDPQPRRVPQPLPPPLFGNPASRPILAGMEHTVRARPAGADRKDEPPAPVPEPLPPEGPAPSGGAEAMLADAGSPWAPQAEEPPARAIAAEGDGAPGAAAGTVAAPPRMDPGELVAGPPRTLDAEVTPNWADAAATGQEPAAGRGTTGDLQAEAEGGVRGGATDGVQIDAEGDVQVGTERSVQIGAGGDVQVRTEAGVPIDAEGGFQIGTGGGTAGDLGFGTVHDEVAAEVAAAAPPQGADPAAPRLLRLPALTEAERAALGLAEPEYHLPSLDLLPLPESERGLSEDEILERALLLERTLASFGVEAKVVDFSFGPAVTRYELQPGPGVRVNKITALADDIALALAATDVRVEAPIPGKSAVGIEVPNKERLAVPLREVLQSPEFLASKSKLTIALGKDNAGNPVVGDLARMPHLLIAGATGSGKSVCMNAIICSLLFKARPDEVKMMMIDPKMVELSIYNGIPHLIAPVITDVRRAAGYLKGAVKEMESRYELFAAAGVRNIEQYNRLVATDPGPDPAHPRKPLPYIVIFIDELADLMMVAPAEVEDAICRLAQMARACGIHLVIATQSPRVDVITGLIKANIPSRIAFAVSSQVDSRVILDAAGAERLLGRGDMLYHPAGLPKPIRAQGAYISEASVEKLVEFVKAQGRPEYTAQEVPLDSGGRRGRNGAPEAQPHAGSALDEALPEAARIIIEHGHASVSLLQRRLRCNYTKAARLIDQLEEMGLIGPYQGSKPREVLATMETWEKLFGSRSGGTGSDRAGE